MFLFCVASFVLVSSLLGATEQESAPALTPAEARERGDESIVVEMLVKTTKDRLEKRGEIYLDSEEDFRSEKNFAVVITKAGAADLKKHGIADPVKHFRDKTVRATGTVKFVDDIPRIEISEARHLKIVDKK